MASGTPVSLPLQSTLPTPGSTVLPPALATALPPHLTALPNQPYSSGNNTTRILLLSEFSPDLKTRDIQLLFHDWEDDRGGFKIKWSDDVSCWIVFNDAAVAKRAFLTLLGNPPPALQPSHDRTPKLLPYTGPDVTQILTAVQNRPRSRSVTNGGHSRKGSALGSGSSLVGGGIGTGGGAGGHTRNQSYGRTAPGGTRGSFGQKQMKEMMEEGEATTPPVPSIPNHLANGDAEYTTPSP